MWRVWNAVGLLLCNWRVLGGSSGTLTLPTLSVYCSNTFARSLLSMNLRALTIALLRNIWMAYSFMQNPIPAPGKPIPPSGTKFCGCEGDGVCGQLGQHCCCYDAKKDDISCQSDPVTSPAQCCGDPAKDCKKDEDDATLPWLH